MRAIDGDAMLARLEEWNTSDSIDKALYSFTLHRIIEQPTIEPERKKGKWKLLPNGNAICSECGYTQVSAWDMDSQDNFCHHCGADMTEEGDPE